MASNTGGCWTCSLRILKHRDIDLRPQQKCYQSKFTEQGRDIFIDGKIQLPVEIVVVPGLVLGSRYSSIQHDVFSFLALIFVLFWQENQKDALALACPGYVINITTTYCGFMAVWNNMTPVPRQVYHNLVQLKKDYSLYNLPN